MINRVFGNYGSICNTEVFGMMYGNIDVRKYL